MCIDSTNAVAYLRREVQPGPDYPELTLVVRHCLREKAEVERLFNTQLDVVHCPRGSVREHQLCDHTARDLMRRGRDGELGKFFPQPPATWGRLLDELRHILGASRGRR